MDRDRMQQLLKDLKRASAGMQVLLPSQPRTTLLVDSIITLSCGDSDTWRWGGIEMHVLKGRTRSGKPVLIVDPETYRLQEPLKSGT